MVSTRKASGERSFWPKTSPGRWAAWLTAGGLAAMVVLPMITVRYREVYPVVDTWVMPAIMALLFDTAAVLSVGAVWRRRERSRLSILVLILTGVAALVSVLVVIGGLVFGE